MANSLLRKALLLPVRWILARKPAILPMDMRTVHRILILRYDAIGDMIVTTALIAVLKRFLPHAVIDVVASPKNASLLEDDPRVDRVMVFDRSFASMMAVRSACADVSYDVVLSFVLNKTTLAGLVAALWGGKRATAVSILHAEREQQYAAWFNVQVPIERNAMTMAAMQIDVFNALFGLSVDAEHEPIDVQISAARHQRAREIANRPHTGLHVILNLSAGNWYRQWSQERNAQLISLLRAAFPNMTISIMADPTRAEMAQALAAMFPTGVRALPTIDHLLTVVAVLGEADLVISPDTSIVHAASNMRTPLVVLYTRRATYVNEWMPHNVPYRAVLTEGKEELEALDPEHVVTAVQELIHELGLEHARTL